MSVKIEHRLGVQAPAETIWAILADVPAWASWNPLYTKAEGVVRIGSPLTLELTLPDREPRTIQPVVIDWVPNEQIHWRLSALGGLVKSIRYLEIDKLTETGCVFSNGELFEGMLGPTVARRLRPALLGGFRAMGEAVKARAEAAWRQAGGGPT